MSESQLLIETVLRIEKKLDDALATLHRHEGVISALKWIAGPFVATAIAVGAFVQDWWRK